jgi:hypothetical protein
MEHPLYNLITIGAVDELITPPGSSAPLSRPVFRSIRHPENQQDPMRSTSAFITRSTTASSRCSMSWKSAREQPLLIR